jgi:hypothetical protein
MNPLGLLDLWGLRDKGFVGFWLSMGNYSRFPSAINLLFSILLLLP